MRPLAIGLLAALLVSPVLGAPPLRPRPAPPADTLDSEAEPAPRQEPEDGVEPQGPEEGDDAGLDDGLDAVRDKTPRTLVRPTRAVAPAPEEAEAPDVVSRTPTPLVNGRAEPTGPVAPAGPLQ